MCLNYILFFNTLSKKKKLNNFENPLLWTRVSSMNTYQQVWPLPSLDKKPKSPLHDMERNHN